MMDGVIEDNATNGTQTGTPPALYSPAKDVAEAAHPGWQGALGGGDYERCEVESRPLRLLLAEPVPQLQRSMVKVLGRLHYEILTATDGFEVLCRLPEWRPDVLLMASDLPRLAGTQVCALLRDSPDFKALPIILLVDSDRFLDVAKARDVGADAYLQRPFRLAELKEALVDIGEQKSDAPWQQNDASHTVDGKPEKFRAGEESSPPIHSSRLDPEALAQARAG